MSSYAASTTAVLPDGRVIVWVYQRVEENYVVTLTVFDGKELKKVLQVEGQTGDKHAKS